MAVHRFTEFSSLFCFFCLKSLEGDVTKRDSASLFFGPSTMDRKVVVADLVECLVETQLRDAMDRTSKAGVRRITRVFKGIDSRAIGSILTRSNTGPFLNASAER
ncbi:uncharacterized protein LY79DRAFT_559827 [Colletotrichum navitas]|uniref:Uncharacterized protein n=1 Tax=Colletotrichum navitas TaxID=681940 RepID=A0AAD8PUN2_9PEZI|nr:uncharacterized protein LY79DRAFT_559827 [Colletotrichum navitas]KAK1584936.1 hypothetical protein LY79DRAFT_559827 [Colletotrichum navitas]